MAPLKKRLRWHLGTRIKYIPLVASKNKKRLRRISKNKKRLPVNKGDLVHIHKSPNYCVEDSQKGIPGTSGRICNKTSNGPDSCDLLCCGRGYNTQVMKHVERCHCKFIWCCYVKCKTCETQIDRHTCNVAEAYEISHRQRWSSVDVEVSHTS
ncbi:hypothetical protein J437_LFUL005535 [Ladona fulva]|uniref:Protein Wnt n=1 Tax=Ladona fulva TaxID=123851 RepID=A0A8K0K2D7_LADFU|nr:hypothetical protein J437_LFUL005535 [Ladona fulva]